MYIAIAYNNICFCFVKNAGKKHANLLHKAVNGTKKLIICFRAILGNFYLGEIPEQFDRPTNLPDR